MKKFTNLLIVCTLLALGAAKAPAQTPQRNQPAATTSQGALHALQSEYKVPYKVWTAEDIKADLDRLFGFVDAGSPAAFVDRQTGARITDLTKITPNSVLERGRFGLTGYEWGVTYSGMLRVAQVTGDAKYANYVYDRFRLLGGAFPALKKIYDETGQTTVRQMINPRALDDSGSMCAAMIKAVMQNPELATLLAPVIDNYFNWVMYREHRLADGTLARNRPQRNSVWLDDMYMGIPAMAYRGRLSQIQGGNLTQECYDAAATQVGLFRNHMWVPEQNLFRHGWVEAMSYHPSFFWGRANGWAILTLCDVLDALPEDHKDYPMILALVRSHLEGLARLQSGDGFWHQLLDRNDSYLETSATAIFTYCFAHAINKGWIDTQAFAPVAQLGWAAVTTKINAEGAVEDVCVGTGMGFDPAYYYYRLVSVNAAHGYGPVLLAGAEMIELVNTTFPRINDTAIQYYLTDPGKTGGIFSIDDSFVE
jgi:rhamnogalacturonyl hydrolase YesR